VEQVAIEAGKYARNEGKSGDFNLARGNLILDIGEAFDLFSAWDKEQLHAALFAKDSDAIRRFVNRP
jgi:hypothetical protein